MAPCLTRHELWVNRAGAQVCWISRELQTEELGTVRHGRRVDVVSRIGHGQQVVI